MLICDGRQPITEPALPRRGSSAGRISAHAWSAKGDLRSSLMRSLACERAATNAKSRNRRGGVVVASRRRRRRAGGGWHGDDDEKLCRNELSPLRYTLAMVLKVE